MLDDLHRLGAILRPLGDDLHRLARRAGLIFTGLALHSCRLELVFASLLLCSRGRADLCRPGLYTCMARRLLGFPRGRPDTLGRRRRVSSAQSRYPVRLPSPGDLQLDAYPTLAGVLHYRCCARLSTLYSHWPYLKVDFNSLSTRTYRAATLQDQYLVLYFGPELRDPNAMLYMVTAVIPRAGVSAAREHARARRGGVREQPFPAPVLTAD